MRRTVVAGPVRGLALATPLSHTIRDILAARLAVAALAVLVSGCAESTVPGPTTGTTALRGGQGKGRGTSTRTARLTSSYDFESAQRRIQAGEAVAVRAGARGIAETAEAAGDVRTAADALTAVAFASTRLGEWQAALDAGRRAIALLTPAPDNAELTLARAHRYVASALMELRRFQDARTTFLAGLELAERARHGQPHAGMVSAMHGGLAAAARQLGDHAAAVAHGERAVATMERALAGQRVRPESVPNFRRSLAHAWLDLANIHLAGGDLAAATKAADTGAAYARLAGAADLETRAMGVRAQVAARQNDGSAERRFAEALTQAERLTQVPLQVKLLTSMSTAQARDGKSREALATARRAIDLVETLRARLQDVEFRSDYFEGKQQLYHRAINLALQLGEPAEAFALAERSRARAFLDVLGTNTALSKGRTQELAEEEARLRARLEAARASEPSEDADETPLAARVEAAARAYGEFLERVRQTSREQAALMTVEPVTLAEIQGLLPERTTMVEYLVTPAEVVAWVVRRDGSDVVRLRIRQAQLIADVRAFRLAIAEQAPIAEVERRALALYRALVEPLRVHVPGDEVIVVPHGPLHYLPFAALRTPGGRWLIEDWRLSTVPSASVLKYLPGKGGAATVPAMALGNPDLGPGLSLRFAEREARAVGEVVPGTRVLVRAEATERQAKLLGPTASVLHFATHAVLDENNPMASALLLVPGDNEDGRLEVREMFRLDLRARLVVLSACETGLGPESHSEGDEVVGLQRAFLYAGAPTVVTTLWKVDDRASFVLMRRFYEELAAHGPAEALRRAQRLSLAETSHPFFWAAFIVTGEPR